jgi:hypothetical protein
LTVVDADMQYASCCALFIFLRISGKNASRNDSICVNPPEISLAKETLQF